MRRREFIGVLGSAAVIWPCSYYQLFAQQRDRVRRMGVLVPSQLNASTLVRRLAELGWPNVSLEYRIDETNPTRMKQGAVEIVASKPDVIFTQNALEAKAVLEQTHTVPIVFATCADPVGEGLVDSFARPGGNVTGFSSFEPGLGGKWIELLKEIAPDVTRVAVIAHPDDPKASLAKFLRATETAAQSFGVTLAVVPDSPKASRSDSDSNAELLRAIDEFARKASGGVIVFPGAHTIDLYFYQSLWLAKRYHLPTIYPSDEYITVGGGLLSYGVNTADNVLRAASYVDRILRGEKPSDLPVQAPIKFELAVNLATAKALGLTIPQSILVRADKIID
jgi:putative ABC transport system substrate-binding protein